MTEAIAGGLFTILMAVLGFFGSKIVQKLDDGVTMLHTVADQLRDNIKEVADTAHTRISKLDTRIAVMETKCGVFHGQMHNHMRQSDITPIIDEGKIK